MKRCVAHHQSGFTLIEVLVATLIMAVLGGALVMTLETVTKAWSRSQEQGEEMRRLMRLHAAFWLDATQTSSHHIFAGDIPSPIIVTQQGGHSGWLRAPSSAAGAMASRVGWVEYHIEAETKQAVRSQNKQSLLWLGLKDPPIFNILDSNAQLHTRWPENDTAYVEPRMAIMSISSERYGDVQFYAPLASLPAEPVIAPELPANMGGNDAP
jgi:prepilin-type N-terminal cleavage/methylation domain-containing protein